MQEYVFFVMFLKSGYIGYRFILKAYSTDGTSERQYIVGKQRKCVLCAVISKMTYLKLYNYKLMCIHQPSLYIIFCELCWCMGTAYFSVQRTVNIL